MDSVFVYTNSKVLATLKENDEKKWKHENMKSEDLEGPIPKDLNGDDGEDSEDSESIFNGEDAMDNDMYNSDDEMFESPNWSNEDLEVNGRYENNFPLDEDNCGYNEGIPLIAKFVHGTRFMSSQNHLANREDSHVQIVERNGRMLVNDGTPQMDKVIPIDESPSMAVA